MFKSFYLALLCSIALPLHAATGKDVAVPMNSVKTGPHSYYVQGMPGAASSENQGFMSNAGFVVTKEGVVVFDALGTPPLAEVLIAKIRKITGAPIKRVIVSHYHADHIYGLQAFKAVGAEIWAHEGGKEYFVGDNLQQRLAQRRKELAPWIDEKTQVLKPDRWLTGDTDFEMGGVHFSVRHVGPAHTAEDLALFVQEDKVLFAGDVAFIGRVPFVGDADSKSWLAALDQMLAFNAKVLVPGHGTASVDPKKDLTLTADYLRYLRKTMGDAVENFVPFDEAYAKTSWKKFERLPAFKDANRPNAYNTYLLLEKEALK